jgi:Leucine-rich repeat (LRR) protein
MFLMRLESVVFLIVLGFSSAIGLKGNFKWNYIGYVSFSNQTLAKAQLNNVDIFVDNWADYPGYGPSDVDTCRFENSSIYSIPPEIFTTFSMLKELIMELSNIQEILPDTFWNASQLSTLILRGNNLTRLPANTFVGATHLTYLLLSDNKISTIDKVAFAGLEGLYNLHLDGNLLTTLDPEIFTAFNRIYILNLSRNKLNALSKSTFSSSHLYGLKMLYLSGNVCVNRDFLLLPFNETFRAQMEETLGVCDAHYRKIRGKVCKKILKG